MRRNPIIVALDVPDAEQALQLVEKLKDVVGGFKIGLQLFIAAGPDLVRRLVGMGLLILLDLKFKDIKETVAKAAAAATKLGVGMMTLHADNRLATMQAAVKSVRRAAKEAGIKRPLLLGVTVLTDCDDKDLAEIGVPRSARVQVKRLARRGLKAGLDGLVCSALEAALLNRIMPTCIRLVTPGIRPAGADHNDQKRVSTPENAMANMGKGRRGKWLVIGRPITEAPDPRAATLSILASLNRRARTRR